MAFKKLVASAVSLTLMAAPTIAQAQASATASAVHEVGPADETVDGSELRGGFIIPLIAIIAVILGILAATSDNDDDLPSSP
ncbi:MAG TPA: hypothetical protein VIT45_15180 [Allosphingosinicella sp.]